MAALTIKETYALARQAGFSATQAMTMTAIAIAESGLRPDAVGDVNLTTTGERSVGLWQINYRPGRDAGNATRDPTRNLDPLTNARHAYEISGGGKTFQPWSTYTNGAYAQNVAAVARALGGADPVGTGGAGGTSGSGHDIDVGGTQLDAITVPAVATAHRDWKIALPKMPDVHLDGTLIMRGLLSAAVVVTGLGLVVLGFQRTVAPAASRTLNSGVKAAETAALL